MAVAFKWDNNASHIGQRGFLLTTHQFLRSSLGSALALAAALTAGSIASAQSTKRIGHILPFNLGQEVDHDEQ